MYKCEIHKRNTNKKFGILFVLIFLLGAGVLFYPTISFWLAERNQIMGHQTYERSVTRLSNEEKARFWEEARYYNERLVNSEVEDPFVSTENIKPFDEYYQTLDTGDGIMGYIHIPQIRVLLPIYHGVSDEVLEAGVGHIPATALPIGGEGTHAVLTGHTGLRHAAMFNDLVELQQGDTFYLMILEQTLAYEITAIKVVLPDDVSSLREEVGKDKVTLVTCTPYSINSHRLLVTGERVPYEKETEQRVQTKAAFPLWIPLAVILLFLLVLGVGKVVRRYAKNA
jgi:LPXTG-site transpeptidase (sortase) family protein